jgi:hypothetical protein
MLATCIWQSSSLANPATRQDVSHHHSAFYDKADGQFAVAITVLRTGSSPSTLLREMAKSGDPFNLLNTELNR